LNRLCVTLTPAITQCSHSSRLPLHMAQVPGDWMTRRNLS
jgi:hypothetical protein